MNEKKYTGQEIEDLVYDSLKGYFAQGIGLYKGGTRPASSKTKDVVVMFHEGANGVYQDGSVLVNAYIPDIKGRDGLTYKDIVSCKSMEQELLSVDTFLTSNTGICFENKDMLYATDDHSNQQHIISLKLRFRNIYY